MSAIGTYVYCIVADVKRPRVPRSPSGLAGLGAIRLLPIEALSARRPARIASELRLFAVVADAPLEMYSETAISNGLSDLDWVSRAAIAHEAVIERFIRAPAVLPMKLFTIFANDQRALAYMHREQQQMTAVAHRVRGQDEWGIRVVLNRARALSTRRAAAPEGRNRGSGAAYLRRKKSQHEAAAGLAERSRDIVSGLYDRLAREATAATRRSINDLPPPGAPLMLDAAYLVPRTRTKSFRSLVVRQAHSLEPQGFHVTLTGPWPPYTFMRD